MRTKEKVNEDIIFPKKPQPQPKPKPAPVPPKEKKSILND